MVGFTAFRIWVSVRQHFNPASTYNLFKHKNPKCKFETYLARKDYEQFERLAMKFTEKEFLVYMVANTLYGNNDCLFDIPNGKANMTYFLKRKESASYLMANELRKIMPIHSNYLQILNLLTKGGISIETVIALNRFVPFVETIRETTDIPVIEPLLVRIERGDAFIRVPIDIEEFIKKNFEVRPEVKLRDEEFAKLEKPSK